MALIQLHGLVPKQTRQRAQPRQHRLLQCGALNALISPFPHMDGFEDLTQEQLAAWATHHNDVLLAYCADNPVLPMAVGAVFSKEAAIQAKVREDIDTHLDSIHRLESLREFAVELRIIGTPPPVPSQAETGRDFLRARRVHRNRRQDRNKAQLSIAQEILAWLQKNSAQLTAANTPKSERILDSVVLIHKANVPALRQFARDQHAPAMALGLDLIISGPWPPYSFEPSAPRELENCNGH